MQYLEVGRRYPLAGGFPVPEGAEFNYTAAGLTLRVFTPDATGREVKAVRAGEARFALAVEGPAIFFLARFGDALDWGDAPFNVHLVDERWQRTTLATPDTGDLRNILGVHLVDARSGELKALRLVGLPTPFTDEFEMALREQVVAGWCGDAEYEAALAEIYRRYSSADLARRAVTQAKIPRIVKG